MCIKVTDMCPHIHLCLKKKSHYDTLFNFKPKALGSFFSPLLYFSFSRNLPFSPFSDLCQKNFLFSELLVYSNLEYIKKIGSELSTCFSVKEKLPRVQYLIRSYSLIAQGIWYTWQTTEPLESPRPTTLWYWYSSSYTFTALSPDSILSLTVLLRDSLRENLNSDLVWALHNTSPTLQPSVQTLAYQSWPQEPVWKVSNS